MGNLQDASRLVRTAVDATIDGLDGLTDADRGAVRLARGYADTIDQADDPGWAYRWIGPLLLDALESLGATPAARARMTKGDKPHASPGQLTRLRTASAQGRRAT